MSLNPISYLNPIRYFFAPLDENLESAPGRFNLVFSIKIIYFILILNYNQYFQTHVLTHNASSGKYKYLCPKNQHVGPLCHYKSGFRLFLMQDWDIEKRFIIIPLIN